MGAGIIDFGKHVAASIKALPAGDKLAGFMIACGMVTTIWGIVQADNDWARVAFGGVFAAMALGAALVFRRCPPSK